MRTRRFELPHPNTNTGPSSQRVYQFRHVRLNLCIKQKKVKRLNLTFCDRAGARTQDPLLKREMLYQLSYQVLYCNAYIKILTRIKVKISDRAGARTQDPLLKREMLYQLSYQVFSNKRTCLRVQIYNVFLVIQ